MKVLYILSKYVEELKYPAIGIHKTTRARVYMVTTDFVMKTKFSLTYKVMTSLILHRESIG